MKGSAGQVRSCLGSHERHVRIAPIPKKLLRNNCKPPFLRGRTGWWSVRTDRKGPLRQHVPISIDDQSQCSSVANKSQSPAPLVPTYPSLRPDRDLSLPHLLANIIGRKPECTTDKRSIHDKAFFRNGNTTYHYGTYRCT